MTIDDEFPKILKKKKEIENQNKIETIRKFIHLGEPIKKEVNNRIIYACYLPLMMEEKFDEEQNKLLISIGFGEEGLKQKGDLIGLAGFFYDTKYYFDTTPSKMFEAYHWFNGKLNFKTDFWWAIEMDTAVHFFDNNQYEYPYKSQMKESTVHQILCLIQDLKELDSLGVDISKKISEIKKNVEGNIWQFEKRFNKAEFPIDYKFSRKALLRVTEARSYISNLASEVRLARFAKINGFVVELSEHPDLLINGKRVEVKNPQTKYKIPKLVNTYTFVNELEDTEIEDLQNVIEDGFRQKPDVLAIEVLHLDKRDIRGYRSKWLTTNAPMKEALCNALNYRRKGIVFLFRCPTVQGSVLACKKTSKIN